MNKKKKSGQNLGYDITYKTNYKKLLVGQSQLE